MYLHCSFVFHLPSFVILYNIAHFTLVTYVFTRSFCTEDIITNGIICNIFSQFLCILPLLMNVNFTVLYGQIY